MHIISMLIVLASPQAEAPAEAKPQVAKEEKKEKLVCKRTKDTGSRLGGKRECKTQEEWNRIAEENQAKARNNM